MPDINKNFKINIDIPNINSLKEVDKLLTDIQDRLDNKKSLTVAQKSFLMKYGDDAKQLQTYLLKARSELESFKHFAESSKISKDDFHQMREYYKEQLNNERIKYEQQERFEQRLASARAAAQRDLYRSALMRSGMGIGEANAEASRIAKGESKYAETEAFRLRRLPDLRRSFSIGNITSEKRSSLEAGVTEAIAKRSTASAAYDAAVKSGVGVKEAAAGLKAAETGVSSAMGAAAAANPWLLAAEAGIAVAKVFNDTVKNVLGVSFSIKDNFKDILDHVSEALNLRSGMATYSAGSSLVMNAQARQLQLQYGLTGGQAYGFQQAAGILGINLSSLEDLSWMNQQQRQLFNDFMGKYSSLYDEMSSSGTLQSIQKFQLDFEIMKRDLSNDLLKWISENKEEIMFVLRGSFEILKGIFDYIAGVFNAFSGPTTDKTAWFGGVDPSLFSDSINNSSVVSNIRTVNVNANNTATGVLSNQEALQAFFSEQMQILAGTLAGTV